jgi:rod shape-determining protein MreC
MLIDYRYKTIDVIREYVNSVLRPLEYVMQLPRNLFNASDTYLTTRATLLNDNATLQQRQIDLSLLANQSELLRVENQHLRQLLSLQKELAYKTIPVEILYNPTNPISQRIVIDRGAADGLKLGNPIASDSGILGQVVRLYDRSAEVSLLEDRDFAVPVQVARNGLRAAVFGTGRANLLELRYLPVASDLEVGDILLTSGIDGSYPPGFAVAMITRIERNVDKNTANVFCTPIAGINKNRQALALLYDPQWDAKPSNTNSENTPGRRKTRTRGLP